MGFKSRKINTEYSHKCYCSRCKEITYWEDAGECSSDCCCDKYRCLSCGKVEYVEIDG